MAANDEHDTNVQDQNEREIRIDPSLSQNKTIDDFIKETRENKANGERIVKWVDFSAFKDIKRIGEGGFANVYSATWLNGGRKYMFTDRVSRTKKIRTLPDTVALKSIKGSNEISSEYIHEMQVYYQLTLKDISLPFYGITQDPTSSEFMLVTGLASNGSLRSVLAKSFTSLNWKKKIHILSYIISDLNNLHEQNICHKDFHSGNILRGVSERYHIIDFGLSGPSNKSSKEIYGVLGYVAPEVLKGKQYNLPADIYSFGIIMTELSSGFPPYFNKNMNESTLALSIIDGLRPDFGKGTPNIYKRLAYKCMNANPNERPTASELKRIISYWYDCLSEVNNDNDAKKIKEAFDIADEEIPNVQSSFEKKSDLKYVSKHLNFDNNVLLKNPTYQLDSDVLGLELPDVLDEDLDDEDGDNSKDN